MDLLPKTKVEMVVASDRTELVIQALCTTARTGKVGDGKLFVTDVVDAIRIRNGERGKSAL